MKFDGRRLANLSCLVSLIVALMLPPAPAAAQTTAAAPEAASSTGPISGYMDFHFNKVEFQDGVLDFHRFVLLFNHSFSPHIRFVGELELEHAFVEGLEEAGEIELEQAYVDFLLRREFNVRAGMVLVPVGIINERHEPPVYHGVERPFVDTVIIPTTWFEAGAGVHGEFGRGFRYRAYVMAPLDCGRSSPPTKAFAKGVRRAPRRTCGNVGVHGPAGIPRSFAASSSARAAGGDESTFSQPRLDLAPSVTVGEIDARFRRQRLELRGQFAHVAISDAASLNDASRTSDGRVAERRRRCFRASTVKPATGSGPRARHAISSGSSATRISTRRHRMPLGFLPLKEFDRDAWVTGVSYYPDPDIAVKVDYVCLRNQSTFIDGAEFVQHRSRLVVLSLRSPRVKVCLIAATMLCVIGVGVGVLARQQSSPRVIHITAERFSFTPSEIAVRLGEEVELRIESEDTSHGFRITARTSMPSCPSAGAVRSAYCFVPNGPAATRSSAAACAAPVTTSCEACSSSANCRTGPEQR